MKYIQLVTDDTAVETQDSAVLYLNETTGLTGITAADPSKQKQEDSSKEEDSPSETPVEDTTKFIGDHGGMLATFNFDGTNNVIGGYNLYSRLQTLYLDGEVYDIDDLVVNVSGGSGNGSNMNGIAFPETITGEHEVEYVLELDDDNTLDISGKGWFDNCLGMTSVTIPNFIDVIDNKTFKGSVNIETCYLNSKFFEKEFSNDSNGDNKNKFTNCFNGRYTVPCSVKKLIMGNYITSIGQYAFYLSEGLLNVTIGNSVTSIGNDAFSICISLTSVTIGNSVTSIGVGAFYNCISLTSITIGNSVTSIGDGAFNYCTSLSSITIPNSVTSIGDNAFSNCSGLTSITYDGTMEQWNAITKGTYWHNNVPSTTVVTCTDGTVVLE